MCGRSDREGGVVTFGPDAQRWVNLGPSESDDAEIPRTRNGKVTERPEMRYSTKLDLG